MIRKWHIQCYTGSKCIGIALTGATVMDNHGAKQHLDADTIVYATGMKAQTDMAFCLSKAAPRQYFFIGDCVKPRKVKQAVHEGFHAGMDVF